MNYKLTKKRTSSRIYKGKSKYFQCYSDTNQEQKSEGLLFLIDFYNNYKDPYELLELLELIITVKPSVLIKSASFLKP